MKKRTNLSWVIRIVLISAASSVVFSFASSQFLGRAGDVAAFAILLVFILIGLVFDMIGVAVMSANEAPFHSMAAHKQRGATEALRLLKNAEKTSSFCTDVVGDVTGIITGSTVALIAAKLMLSFSTQSIVIQLVISGAVTGLTTGSKAVGKTLALNNNTAIVLRVGKLMHVFGALDKNRDRKRG
ncbi:MAG: hypothetical protein FWG48_05065 [Oscillospiraceae bacterium]|nr:hypothetical protein [Oscillospiraceae bacterium]